MNRTAEAMLLYPWAPKSASGPHSVGNLVWIGSAIASKAKLRQINPLVEADADPFTVYPGDMSFNEHCTAEANRNPLPFYKGDIVAEISPQPGIRQVADPKAHTNVVSKNAIDEKIHR